MNNNSIDLSRQTLSHWEGLDKLSAVYFFGAGGIGMSAIARYFMSKGLVVAGYDTKHPDGPIGEGRYADTL